jgi:outer membrane protein
MTRNFARIAVVSLALSMSALAQTGTTAAAAPATAPTGPTKIGIINIQGAVANTNEGKRDLEGLDKKMEPKVKELQALQAEVENLTKQLNTQGDKLNEEAKANLQKQITAKTKDFTRGRDDYQADVQAQEQDIFQRIYPKVMQSVDAYAKSNNFSLILDWGVLQQGVTWANPSYDITQQIVEAYNTSSGIAAPPASATRPSTPKSAPGAVAPKSTAPKSTTTPKQ